MALVDLLRRGHERLIEENPIDALIQRTERVRKGGGFEELTFYVGLVRGRLHQEASGRAGAEESISTPGILHHEARWGFICATTMQEVDPETGALIAGAPLIETDIQAGAHVTDSFEHERHGTVTITSVYPREDLGVVWGWGAAAEITR